MTNKYQSKIVHWICDALTSLAVACLVVPEIAKLAPVKSLLATTNNHVLAGVLAGLGLVLAICWATANGYLRRYRNTWVLKKRPSLLIDDLAIVTVLTVAVCLKLRIPSGLHVSLQAGMAALIGYAAAVAWLTTAYYIALPTPKPTEEDEAADLSDEPITALGQDELGREDFVKALAEDITSLPFNDSFVFGITGRWGEGKTSTINMLKRVIAKKDDFLIVEYTPWFFESHNALLSAFYGLIEKTIGKTFIIPNLKRAMIRYQQVIKNGLNLSGISVDFSLRAQTPDELKTVIEKYLGSTEKKLVIIVDELDRLQTDELMFVLQLIKLNTNLKNTIFILAYDPEMVKENLPAPYNKDFKYLEKIVQRQVPLPAVQQKTINGYIDKQLDLLFDKLKVSDDRRRAFEKDFPYLYQTQFTHFLRTLRSSKQFLNIVNSSLPPIVDEVNLSDFMVMELIHYAAPDLYADIWQNAWSYIPTTWSHQMFAFAGERDPIWTRNDADRYKPMKEHIQKLLEGNEEKDALIELLETVFPVTVKNAMASTPTNYDGTAQRYLREQRITHPDIFIRFFMGKVPFDEMSDKDFNAMLTTWTAETRAVARRQLMQQDIEKVEEAERITEFLRKLNTFSAVISTPVATDLIVTLAANSKRFSRTNSQEFFRSDFEQALAAMFRLLNEKVPTDKIQGILKRIVKNSDDVVFQAHVLTWCQRDQSSSLTNVTNAADLGALRTIVEAKLKQTFIDTGTDIFQVYPEPVDRSHLLYQWSRGWSQNTEPNPELTQYLKDTFTANFRSYRLFIETYIDPWHEDDDDEARPIRYRTVRLPLN